MNDNWKISSSLIPSTDQVVNSHIWLVDTILDSADIETSIITENSFGQEWFRVRALTVGK